MWRQPLTKNLKQTNNCKHSPLSCKLPALHSSHLFSSGFQMWLQTKSLNFAHNINRVSKKESKSAIKTFDYERAELWLQALLQGLKHFVAHNTATMLVLEPNYRPLIPRWILTKEFDLMFSLCMWYDFRVTASVGKTESASRLILLSC